MTNVRDKHKGRFSRYATTVNELVDELDDFLEWQKSTPKGLNHLNSARRAAQAVLLQLDRFEQADTLYDVRVKLKAPEEPVFSEDCL